MSLYIKLLLVQINQRMGLSVLRYNLKNDRKAFGKSLFMGFAILLAIGSVVGVYTFLLWQLMPAFISVGMGSVILGIVFLIAIVLMFFFGLVFQIGILFFGKDSAFLSALPIPSGTIYAVKFTQVFLSEWGTSLGILLPPVVLYGVFAQAPAVYWLALLPVLLLSPAIPLAIAGVCSLLMMRMGAFWRRRELFVVLGTILILVLTFSVQIFIQRTMVTVMQSPDDLTALAIDSAALLSSVTSAFPPALWAVEGLTGNASSLLLFLGVSLAALLSVWLLSRQVYARAVQAQLEMPVNARSTQKAKQNYLPRNPLWAMVRREWVTVLRSPTYAMNGLLMIVFGPLIMLFPMLLGNMPSSNGGASMQELFDMLQNNVEPSIIFLVMVAFLAMMTAINPAATTGFSREGKMFYLAKMMPVSPRTQTLAKYLFGVSIMLLGILPMAVTAGFVLGISVTMVCFIALGSAAAGFGLLPWTMLMDATKPKLIWNTETEAIKQNFASVIGMFLSWGILAVVGVLCFFLIQFGVSALLISAMVMLFSLLLGAIGLHLLLKRGEKTIQTLEP